MSMPPARPDPAGRARALRRLDALGYALDDSIPIPGTGARIGVDPLLGLVPGVGDVAGSLLSAYIVVEAARLGVPGAALLRMLLNVGVEALLGVVPVLGDLFDAAWKANARNVALLRRELERPGSTRRASILVVAGVGVAVAAIGVGAGVLSLLAARALWALLA